MTEELTGGNSNTVVKVGRTVHRTAGPWTPAVHRLLRTARAAGITEVPEPLGFDDEGREVLSFVPGEAGNYPLPAWLWNPAIVDDAAALLRRLHDATVGMVGEELVWGSPVRHPAEVICHNDVAPYNMAFADGRLVGLFDFDTAAPGPRVWDVAYLAYRLVPLVEDAGPGAPASDTRPERLERLLTAYGATFSTDELLATLVERLRVLADDTDARAAASGNAGLLDHAAMYRRDADVIARMPKADHA